MIKTPANTLPPKNKMIGKKNEGFIEKGPNSLYEFSQAFFFRQEFCLIFPRYIKDIFQRRGLPPPKTAKTPF